MYTMTMGKVCIWYLCIYTDSFSSSGKAVGGSGHVHVGVCGHFVDVQARVVNVYTCTCCKCLHVVNVHML